MMLHDYDDFDVFTRAYVECALWTEQIERDDSDDSDDPIEPIDRIDHDTLDQMFRDCRQFQSWHMADIAGREEDAGHDFWLTRNGHGAGFWDGDWEDSLGERLTSNCKAYGEFELYTGDDGYIYN
jgi:hypothetical protein